MHKKASLKRSFSKKKKQKKWRKSVLGLKIYSSICEGRRREQKQKRKKKSADEIKKVATNHKSKSCWEKEFLCNFPNSPNAFRAREASSTKRKAREPKKALSPEISCLPTFFHSQGITKCLKIWNYITSDLVSIVNVAIISCHPSETWNFVMKFSVMGEVFATMSRGAVDGSISKSETGPVEMNFEFTTNPWMIFSLITSRSNTKLLINLFLN